MQKLIAFSLLLSLIACNNRQDANKNTDITASGKEIEIQSSQIPVIKAVGGEGKMINWAKEKKKADPNGPGFFYNDCAQGTTAVSASSSQPNQGTRNYKINNINDNDPMTAWIGGKSDYGIGEFFEIKANGVNQIYNGYQESPEGWANNSRVKKFKVYKNTIPLCILELTDEMGEQRFELPDHKSYDPENVFTYKFEILDVYNGAKWKDVAISEINMLLCCFSAATTISSTQNAVNIAEIKNGETIFSVDINSGKISNTEIIKTTKQTHLSLLKISCETKAIEITFDHPLYIKDYGFISINKYMEIKHIEKYEELIDKIEFLTWDDVTKKAVYEKLKNIVLTTGVFETYSISKLSTGNTFIANGFVTKIY